MAWDPSLALTPGKAPAQPQANSRYTPKATSILGKRLAEVRQYGTPSQQAKAKKVAAGGSPSLSGRLLEGLSAIQAPMRAIVATGELGAEALTGKKYNKSWLENVKDATYGTGKLIEALAPDMNVWDKRLLGLTGDIALDPLTYLTFGASPALKALGKSEGLANLGWEIARYSDKLGEYANAAGKTEDALHATEQASRFREMAGQVLKKGSGALKPEQLNEFAEASRFVSSDPTMAGFQNIADGALTHGVGFHVPLLDLHTGTFSGGPAGMYGRALDRAGSAIARAGNASKLGDLIGGQLVDIKRVLRSGDVQQQEWASRIIEGWTHGKAAGAAMEKETVAAMHALEAQSQRAGLTGEMLTDALRERQVLHPKSGEVVREAGGAFKNLNPEQQAAAQAWGDWLDSIPGRTEQLTAHGNTVRGFIKDSREAGRSYTPRTMSEEFKDWAREQRRKFSTKTKTKIGEEAWFEKRALKVGDTVGEGDAARVIVEPDTPTPHYPQGAPVEEQQIMDAVQASYGTPTDPAMQWYEPDFYKSVKEYQQGLVSQVRNNKVQNFLRDKGISNDLMTWVYDDKGKRIAIPKYARKVNKAIEKNENRMRSTLRKMGEIQDEIAGHRQALVDGKIGVNEYKTAVEQAQKELDDAHRVVLDADEKIKAYRATEAEGAAKADQIEQVLAKDEEAFQAAKEQHAEAQARLDEFVKNMPQDDAHFAELQRHVAAVDAGFRRTEAMANADSRVQHISDIIANNLAAADALDKHIANGTIPDPQLDSFGDFLADLADTKFGGQLTQETMPQMSALLRGSADSYAKEMAQYAKEFPAHTDPVLWGKEAKAAGQRKAYWGKQMSEAAANMDDEAFDRARLMYEDAARAQSFRRDLILRSKTSEYPVLADVGPETQQRVMDEFQAAIDRYQVLREQYANEGLNIEQPIPGNTYGKNYVDMARLANAKAEWESIAGPTTLYTNPATGKLEFWHGFNHSPVDIGEEFPLGAQLSKVGAWIDFIIGPSLSANFDFSHEWVSNYTDRVQAIMLNTGADRVLVYAPGLDVRDTEGMFGMLQKGPPSEAGPEGTMTHGPHQYMYAPGLSGSQSGAGYQMFVSDAAKRYLNGPGNIDNFLERVDDLIAQGYQTSYVAHASWQDVRDSYALAKDIMDFMAGHNKPMEWDEALHIAGRHYDITSGAAEQGYEELEGHLINWGHQKGVAHGDLANLGRLYEQEPGVVSISDYGSGTTASMKFTRERFDFNRLLDPTFPRPMPNDMKWDGAALSRALTDMSLPKEFRDHVVLSMRDSLMQDADVVMFFNGENGGSPILQVMPVSQYVIEATGSDVGKQVISDFATTGHFKYEAGPLSEKITHAKQTLAGKFVGGPQYDALRHEVQQATGVTEAARSTFEMTNQDYTNALKQAFDAGDEANYWESLRDTYKSYQLREKQDALAKAAEAYRVRDQELADPFEKQIAHLEGKYREMEAHMAGLNSDWLSLMREHDKVQDAMTKVLQQGNVPFGFKGQAPADVVDMLGTIDRSYDPVTGEGLKTFFKHYDHVNNWLKGWLTSSVGFQFRNWFGAMFNNWLAGADVTRSAFRWGTAYDKLRPEALAKAGITDLLTPENIERAVKELGVSHADVAAMKFNQELGITGSGLYHSEVGQIARPSANPFAGIAGGEKAFVLPYATKKMGEQWVEPMARGSLTWDRANQAILNGRFKSIGIESWEDINSAEKVAAFHKALMSSPLATEMLDDVAKFHFDYDDLSRFERQYMRRIIPFYTWTRKNVPLQIEAMFTQPGKALGRYLTFKRNIELGTDQEDVVPSWFAEQGMIRLPWQIGGQQTYGTVDLPFRDPFKAADVTGQLTGMVSPLIKAPIEAWAGKQFFNDVPLRDTYAPMPGVWSIVPGLPEAMRFAAKLPFVPISEPVKEKGQWYMRDKDMYVMGQYLPFLYQTRRLVPSEPKYQNRVATSLMSYLGGVALRTNTPQDIEAEVFRRTRELDSQLSTMKATGQIPKKPTKPKREVRTTLQAALANIEPTDVRYSQRATGEEVPA